MIKVTEAMRANVRPPTLHADEPLDALLDSPFRILRSAEPWETNGTKRAGISAFGFGGNNSHVIVEEYEPEGLRGFKEPRQVCNWGLVKYLLAKEYITKGKITYQRKASKCLSKDTMKETLREILELLPEKEYFKPHTNHFIRAELRKAVNHDKRS